jgi:predicted nuclease with TOPRIM domain
MPFSVALTRKMDDLDPEIKDVLWTILDEVEKHREASVTKSEFAELREIVRGLAQATARLAERQDKTEAALTRLAERQDKTEAALTRLAEAQERTEKEVAKLGRALNATRSQVGGLAKSVAYALENEAFRRLPAHLEARYGIKVRDRFVRTLLAGEEISLYAHAERDGEPVEIVGESVLKLDDRAKLKQLEKNLKAVGAQSDLPIVPLLITHFAHPSVLERAEKQGILVVQSFEWE